MKVLVALDGSAVSIHAARRAARLFEAADAEFFAINVARIPTGSIYPAAFGGVAAIAPFDLQRLAESSQATAVAAAERVGIADAEVIADVGDPVSRICAAADEHDVDVVVVGSHDRGVLSRLVAPSVSAGVVRGTYRPVLVVSGHPPELSGETT